MTPAPIETTIASIEAALSKAEKASNPVPPAPEPARDCDGSFTVTERFESERIISYLKLTNAHDGLVEAATDLFNKFREERLRAARMTIALRKALSFFPPLTTLDACDDDERTGNRHCPPHTVPTIAMIRSLRLELEKESSNANPA